MLLTYFLEKHKTSSNKIIYHRDNSLGTFSQPCCIALFYFHFSRFVYFTQLYVHLHIWYIVVFKLSHFIITCNLAAFLIIKEYNPYSWLCCVCSVDWWASLLMSTLNQLLVCDTFMMSYVNMLERKLIPCCTLSLSLSFKSVELVSTSEKPY